MRFEIKTCEYRGSKPCEPGEQSTVLSDCDCVEIVDLQIGDDVQLIDLSTLSVIDITGNDAASFLQGQFCNDVGKVSDAAAQLNGYCSPKGRLLALPTVIGMGAGFRLLLPEQLTEAFVKRIRMYVMRSEVTVTIRMDMGCTGLIAYQQDSDKLSSLLGALPEGIMEAISGESRQVIRWHDDYTTEPSPRYLIVSSKAEQGELLASVNVAQRGDVTGWRLADISAGIPTVTNETADSFVPQMLNLHLINALSFKKGCYPGQEIVARMQYLGKLKRHMRLFHLPLTATDQVQTPQPGDNVSAGTESGTESDSSAGVIIDAVQFDDRYIALLTVVKVSASGATFTLSGRPLESVDLPYELPTLVPDEETVS